MKHINKTFGQRGTLLMEAIAMLGLIAMVTPTLYKKSAERMQEIQDINIAGQARNMDHIISTFIYSHINELKSDSSGIGTGNTIKLSYEDTNQDGYFKYGYSAYVPAGYTPKNLKTYGEPEIYVYRYGDSATSGGRDAFVYYIVYPNLSNHDDKRAARVASLVGANGGTVIDRNGEVGIYGTGGGWGLDSSLIGSTDGKVNIPDSSLIKNSLVITSQEPVTADMIDSEVFLYRVYDDEAGNNTMQTSLYMGGVDTGDDANSNKRFNSIYNVRKLTLNTRCDPNVIRTADSTGADCPANVADLYIGKPLSDTITKDQAINESNTGAAWIYGNLSALNQSFQLHNDYDGNFERTGADEMTFGNYDNSEGVEGNWSSKVFYANNDSSDARVAMMDDFVQVKKNGGAGERQFLVGDSSVPDAFIGVYEGSSTVRINSPDDGLDNGSSITHINRGGGSVYIGGRSDSSTLSNVIINDNGGVLAAGKDGGWIYANGLPGSSAVHILKETQGSDLFTVGGSSIPEHYIRADSSAVSLSNRRLQVFDNNDNWGGFGGAQRVGILRGESSIVGSGVTAITTHYTDILGSTYLGSSSLANDSAVIGGHINLNSWNLAVAGSAYVDSTLAANEAWFKSIGGKELHAGFSSYDEWKNGDHKKAMLNVYDSSLIVRNRDSDGGDDPGDFGVSSGTGVYMYIGEGNIPIRIQDTKGAALQMADGIAQFGSEDNIVQGDSTGVQIYAKKDTSSTVNIQNSAMVFTKQPGDMEAAPENEITARAGVFSVRTLNNAQAYSSGLYDGAQFYVDSSETGVRNVNFKVGLDNAVSSTAFYVVPRNYTSSGVGTTDEDGNATVNVDGSFHVKGNKVIHIASDSSNAATGGNRAMFEVDPKYIQVQQIDSSGAVDGNYSIFKVNPGDSSGAPSLSDDTANVGVYVRRGAIELEKSIKVNDSSVAADAGYGYILANRLVSNAGKEFPALPESMVEGYTGNTKYDQYMVNPAYTSVMHDIKLTTRGGARLSDVLPDYVLKGVYNLSNNCEEGTSSGVSCNNPDMNMWASPYVGIIPYASCPPGYLNMTTLMPTSFNVGRAGRLIKDNRGGERWVVGSGHHQARILDATQQSGIGYDGDKIKYPSMEMVNTFTYNSTTSGWEDFSSWTNTRTEGWFLGAKAIYENSSTDTVSKLEPNSSGTTEQYWEYYANKNNGNDWQIIAEPLYFQQNTWLKTTVAPEGGESPQGWKAYMGFIYDVHEWGNNLGSTIAPVGNIFQKDGSSVTGLEANDFRWNVFPVPTNTIEGHAMVYCYFDRKAFKNWNDGDGEPLVDQIDQLGALKGEPGAPSYRGVGEKPYENYNKRLNDPTLKYDDPW